jgi:hypothetical protein
MIIKKKSIHINKRGFCVHFQFLRECDVFPFFLILTIKSRMYEDQDVFVINHANLAEKIDKYGKG